MAEEVDARALVTGVARKFPSIPELQFIRDDEEGVVIEELLGGYANYTFRVIAKDKSKSIVVKHGKDHFKVFKGPAPLRRRLIEYEMMKRLETVTPGSAPKPICLDMEENIIVMEDLSHMTLLRTVTEAGQTDEDAMRLIAKLLAKLHWTTQEKNMTETAWKELKEMFGYSPILIECRDFCISEMVNPASNSLEYPGEMDAVRQDVMSDPALLARVAEMRTLADTERCLIHSDNHHNSVFTAPGRVVLFDFEVSGLSIPESNIGVFLMWFVCSLHILPESEQKEEARLRFRSATRIFLDTYIEEMPDMKDDAYKCSFLSNMAFYLAAMVYRTIACPGIDQFFPGTTAQRAGVMRLAVAGMRATPTLTTVNRLLDQFFPEPNAK